jgi:hypothetical protein
VTALRQVYETTPHAQRRRRSHLGLLAPQGHSVAAIAAMVLRRRDTVERVLQRFLQGELAALPPRTAPGRAPTITPAWHAERLRGIDLAPPPVGDHKAPWPPGLGATYLGATTGSAGTAETVRWSLHAAAAVGKRPTEPLTRTAAAPPGSVGNACGGRGAWPGRARPPAPRRCVRRGCPARGRAASGGRAAAPPAARGCLSPG